jgi:hypothetical protein
MHACGRSDRSTNHNLPVDLLFLWRTLPEGVNHPIDVIETLIDCKHATPNQE